MSEDLRTPETDVLHPSGKNINWNESFYFNLYDKKEDICAFMRIGLKPNIKEKSMLCFFMMPDGSSVGTRSEEEFKDSSLSVDGLSFKRIQPEKEWRLEYKGRLKRTLGDETHREDVSFNLGYQSICRTFDYRECWPANRELESIEAAGEHTEQFGKILGTARIGNTDYSLEGLGERDHSWGVRDWIAPNMWIWLSCQFSGKLAFNVTKLILGKEVVDAGYVHIDGENRPIVKAFIDTTVQKSGAPLSLKISLLEKGREVHEIQATVMRTVKVPFSGISEKSVPVMYESLAKYRKGNEVGYGIAEHLVRRI